MDLEIRTKGFRSFLNRCRLEKIVDDLIFKVSGNNLLAHFGPNDKTIVAEVSEPISRCFEVGDVKIPSISGLISQVDRIREESEMIRIVTSNDKVVITDGKKAECATIRVTQVADESFVKSFEAFRTSIPVFLKEPNFKFLDNEFQVGVEISYDTVQTIMKDAKAFGYDIYMFEEKDGLLNCTIKTKSKELSDSFNRKLNIISKIGTGPIPTVFIGHGFREVMKSFFEKDVKFVKMFFHENAILITDGIKTFYNMQTIPQD